MVLPLGVSATPKRRPGRLPAQPKSWEKRTTYNSQEKNGILQTKQRGNRRKVGKPQILGLTGTPNRHLQTEQMLKSQYRFQLTPSK